MSYFTQSCPELHGMRVAKYIRCSHEDQAQHGDTLEAQDDILNDFIQKNGLVLVDTFVDEALTARKKFTKRKEFIRLLDGVKRHDFDIIIFTKLDRWFRNIGDYHRIQEILEANQVQWKAVTESYDTTTTNGRLHINIRLSVAQDECDRDSDRIKDVFAHKLRNRTYISGNLPRGLKLDAGKHIVIDEDWKQYVLDLFDVFEATNSKRKTFLLLKDRYNLPQLNYDTVIRQLKQPLYKGQYKDDLEFCPAIIDPVRFDRIQQLAKRDVRNSKQNTFLFSGLLICSECGHPYAGSGVRHKLASGDTKVYKTYKCCNHYNNARCSRSGGIREEKVEAYMLDHIRPALEGYVASFSVGESVKIRKPQDEVAKLKKKLKKLYDLYMDDMIDRDMYDQEYTELQSALSDATAAASVQPKNVAALQEALSDGWEEIYKTFSEEEKAMFWKGIIDKVVMEEGGDGAIYFL